MSQHSWKPLRLTNLEQQIDQAFHELIQGRWGFSPPRSSWQPEIDVYELPDCYLVEADVPGVALEEITIEVAEHSLTISGARRSGTVEQSAQGVWIERRMGSFFRRFHLEHAVIPEEVERTHQAGTILIRLPRRKPAASAPHQ